MGYIVVGPDGSEHGPVEVETLAQWAREGSLPPNAPVRDAATGTRTTAGQMIELQQVYGSMKPANTGHPPLIPGGSIIPTGNPDALWGYYLGWGSLPCVIGIAVAPFAIIKSIKGYKAYKANPEIKGGAHAITGIVLASIGLLVNIGIIVAFVMDMSAIGS